MWVGLKRERYTEGERERDKEAENQRGEGEGMLRWVFTC
jgi:hypothetical protein